MIRGNGWKYAYNTPLRSAGTVYTPELYHLEEDPLETTNLWNVPARRGKAKELHARLRAWLAETNDPWLAYIPEDPDKPETAKAL
jgi:hypothetical protein